MGTHAWWSERLAAGGGGGVWNGPSQGFAGDAHIYAYSDTGANDTGAAHVHSNSNDAHAHRYANIHTDSHADSDAHLHGDANVHSHKDGCPPKCHAERDTKRVADCGTNPLCAKVRAMP